MLENQATSEGIPCTNFVAPLAWVTRAPGVWFALPVADRDVARDKPRVRRPSTFGLRVGPFEHLTAGLAAGLALVMAGSALAGLPLPGAPAPTPVITPFVSPPSISATPSIFNAGCPAESLVCATRLLVNGSNFVPADTVRLWLDVSGSGVFGGVDPWTYAVPDGNGSFSERLIAVAQFPVGIYHLYAAPIASNLSSESLAATSVTVSSSFSCVSSEIAWRSWTECTVTVIDPDHANVTPSGNVTFHSSDLFDGTSYGSAGGTSFGAKFDSSSCVLAGVPHAGLSVAPAACNVGFTEDNCPAYIGGSCWGRTALQNHDTTITAVAGITQPSAFSDVVTSQVEFQTCFMHPCLVNTHAGEDYSLDICILGDSVYDLINYCKLMEQDYTTASSADWKHALSDTTDPPYIGVQFPGAGLLASVAGALAGEPFNPTECAGATTPLDIELVYANTLGEVVPGAGACPLPGTKTLLSDYILGLGFLLGDWASNNLSGTVVSQQQSGIDAYMFTVLSGVLATGNPLVIGAALSVFAIASVVLAVGCGYTDDHCFGKDLTANMLADPLEHGGVPLAQQQIPFPVLGGQIAPVWGYFVGWSAPPVCTLTSGGCPNVVPNGDYYNETYTPSEFKDYCKGLYPVIAQGCPTPGSAGSAPQGSDPLVFGESSGANPNGPVVCVTGRADGRSIGYDGDVSFDVQTDPSLTPAGGDRTIESLVNVYNYLPGEGGSAPPNGIDVEISLALRPGYATLLGELGKGTALHVCGHWVTDLFDFWNEIHPVTSLSILVVPPTIVATPTALDLGESAALSTTVAPLGGTLPYTCQWLSEAPGASSLGDFGGSFACNDTSLPSTSTGALPKVGNWTFELQVTDNTGQVGQSNAATVLVNPPLTGANISASPGAVDLGHNATLGTIASFGGGTAPFACQWLVEAPGAQTFGALGAGFACPAASLPTTSTGALNSLGAWSFVLQVNDSGTPFESVDSNVVSVTVGSTTLTYSGATGGQYGDTVVLAATLTSGATKAPVSGETIVFVLGGHTLSAVTNETGVASVTQQLDDIGGGYALGAAFLGDAPNGWLPSCTTNATPTLCSQTNPAFTLGREDTLVTYTGDVVVSTTVGTFTMRATLQVDSGTGPTDSGVLTQAYVVFTIYSLLNTTVPLYTILHVPSGVVTPSELATAMVSETLCSSKVTTGCLALPQGVYVVRAQIEPSNGYYSSSTSEGVAFTVYTPSGAFVSGGGFVPDPTSGHGNFAFLERYTKSGQPSGQSVYIYRESCGSSDIRLLETVSPQPGDVCDVMVKSNAMIGLAIGASCSTFQGKSTIQVMDASSGVLLGSVGNYQFTVQACNGGVGVGTYALQVLNPYGIVFHSVGSYPSGTPLGGGLIIVHQS